MFNSEELQFMLPKMSIEYRVEEGFLTSGTFDKIPVNAFGAYVSTKFPAVGANGKFKITRCAFNLFVGEGFLVDDVLAQANKTINNSENDHGINESVLKRIKKYKEQGYQRVANTKIGVVPLDYNDAVFATNKEMAEAITKIHQTFKSVDFSIRNSQDGINKSLHR